MTAFEANSSELGFSATYLNGQRGVRVHSAAVGPKFDRLEPIETGDHKTLWYGEIRRVMGISVGSTAEDNSFGAAAAHMKPSPPSTVVKDLKRFRLSVFDTCVKARDRANKMDEHLHKLDKYCEAVSSKKQQRRELVINERAGALNLKMGAQIYNINQRVEDRPKNILLNKRVRTSMAESRAECQNNVLQRQHVAMTKDGNLLKDKGQESDLYEKIRRLAAGGEGWDNKIKRKRSVATGFTRPIDNDGVPKRASQKKVVEEHDSQPHDSPICRLGASKGTGGSNKPNITSLPNNSRNLIGGSKKERIITKENSKLNNRDTCYNTISRNPVTKSKTFRTARIGSMGPPSSSPSAIPYVPGTTLDSWRNGTEEEDKHDGNNNRKRPLPMGPPSSPMAQWVGQRPQKMSRARRSNLVSPVSNKDSDVGTARLASNGSPISRNAKSGPHKIKREDNFQSPLGLYESDESDKEMGNSAKKNRPLINGESGNGVWRKGSLVSRPIKSPMGNRLDNAATTKPPQRSKTGCKKKGSKPGRRLKKLSDHKSFSHQVPLQNNSSPDCTGVSDDDREELLEAANHARTAGRLKCSTVFWKKMEPMFASISSEDKSFVSQQVGCVNDDSVSGERNENSSISGRYDSDKTSTPLYQRVLSALIIEDDIDDLEEERENAFSVSTYDTHRLNGSDPRVGAKMDTNRGQTLDSGRKSFPNNGGINLYRNCIINSSVCEDAGISTSFMKKPQMEGVGCEYEEMCLNDKLLMELQSIGLCPETLPYLEDKENETILTEVDKLKSSLHQQEVKKKVYLEKICKDVGSNSSARDLETLAMDRLVEQAYKKLSGSRRSSRSGGQKQVALAFGKRTLARCHKYENSGTSCFNEPPFQDILSAPIQNEPEPTNPVPSRTKLLSDEVFAINGPISNKGKKKEVFLDDVTNLGGTAKGKRSRTERKTKSKPKPRQKMKESTTHPVQPWLNGSSSQSADTRKDVTNSLHDDDDDDDLDPIAELSVGGGDLSSFLNFDEQDLDEDFAGGLDIPMDDLTELF